jgi:hypothetical protein
LYMLMTLRGASARYSLHALRNTTATLVSVVGKAVGQPGENA